MAILRTLLCSVILAVAIGGRAQTPFTIIRLPLYPYNGQMLVLPNVQKDMHLTAKVVQRVRLLFRMKPLRSQTAKRAGSYDAAADQNFETVSEKSTKAILPYLTASQKVRLNQITLQMYGPTALLDGRVSDQLGLTHEQRISVVQHLTERSGTNTPPPQEDFTRFRARWNATIDAILNASQKKAWIKMQGPQIDLGLSSEFHLNTQDSS